MDYDRFLNNPDFPGLVKIVIQDLEKRINKLEKLNEEKTEDEEITI